MDMGRTNMTRLYVADTNSLIAFFHRVFSYAPDFHGAPTLSRNTEAIIEQSVFSPSSLVRLSIPSVIFFEIHEKWLRTEEFLRRFYYDVFVVLRDAPNVEIRPIDKEILGNLIRIGGCLAAHDLHDKLVVATAMTLECHLITTDTVIQQFVKLDGTVPDTLS